MHRAELASRSQKHGVKDLLPGVLGIAAPLRQSLHPRGKIEHLVQIAFEPMPAREAYDFSFSFKNRPRLILQRAAAAASKRWRNWILSRTCSTMLFGTWKVLGWPSIRTEIWYWVCRLLPAAQGQFGRPPERLVSTKAPASISRNKPRRRPSRPRS